MLLGGLVVAVKLRPTPVPAAFTNMEIVSWQQKIHDEPENPWNWVSLGEAYLVTGDPDQAKTAFEKVLTLDETNWEANLQLAQMVEDTDQARAMDYLNVAAKSAPIDSVALVETTRGDILYAQGDFKAARQAYAKAAAAEPSLYEARMGLGRSLQALGDSKGALAQYRFALKVAPEDPDARYAIAHVQESIPPSPSPSTTPAP